MYGPLDRIVARGLVYRGWIYNFTNSPATSPRSPTCFTCEYITVHHNLAYPDISDTYFVRQKPSHLHSDVQSTVH